MSQNSASTIDIAVLTIERKSGGGIVLAQGGDAVIGTMYLVPSHKIQVDTAEVNPLAAGDEVLENILGRLPEKVRDQVRDVLVCPVTSFGGIGPEHPMVIAEAVSIEMRMAVAVMFWKRLNLWRASYSAITAFGSGRTGLEGITTLAISTPTPTHKAMERELKQLIKDARERRNGGDNGSGGTGG